MVEMQQHSLALASQDVANLIACVDRGEDVELPKWDVAVRELTDAVDRRLWVIRKLKSHREMLESTIADLRAKLARLERADESVRAQVKWAIQQHPEIQEWRGKTGKLTLESAGGVQGIEYGADITNAFETKKVVTLKFENNKIPDSLRPYFVEKVVNEFQKELFEADLRAGIVQNAQVAFLKPRGTVVRCR